MEVCQECMSGGGVSAVDGCVRSVGGPEGTLSPHGDLSNRIDSDSMNSRS